MQDFAGIWVPLITPFADDGAVDHAALRRLAEHLASSGIAGFVACGSTGEAALLDEAERAAVLQTIRSLGLPVIVGLSGTAPEALAAQAARCEGLAGVLVAPPAYLRPAQAGIEAFFRTIADASAAPLLLYDIPARTGVRIETATMLALAAHPSIAGVKDCSGDADHVQAVLNDGRLQVLCGDDNRLFTTLCQGGVGAVAASAHLCTARFVELHQLLHAEQLNEAASLWRQLWPLTKALFAEPSPGPLKGALARRHPGLGNRLRAPMTAAGAACIERVMEAAASA